MSNMSYCRNENTLPDLRDVRANDLHPTNDYERSALLGIIRECANLLRDFDVTISESQLSNALDIAQSLRTTDEIEYGNE